MAAEKGKKELLYVIVASAILALLIVGILTVR